MTMPMPLRATGCIVAVALTIAASELIRKVDATAPPDVRAQEILRQDSPDLPKAIGLYIDALRRDPANPYRWSDLAAAYSSSKDIDHARACYQRALDLSGDVPQIWLRAANFHFELGEYEKAIPLAALVLKTVPNYDEVLFSYFDHLLPGPELVFRAIGANRRAITAYTQHLIDTGNMNAARQSWYFLQRSKWNDGHLTTSYIDAMLREHRYADAQQDWVAFLGSEAGGYPVRNLLFNGGFERERTGSSLDWRIESSSQFETVRDSSVARSGKWSLRIQFDGRENVQFANLSQIARVTPGRYSLSAWIRAENITTDEGIRLEIQDAEAPGRLTVKTDAVTGTTDWRAIEQSFLCGPQTNLLAIRVVRAPSHKFDSKISGKVWLDDVALTRL